MLNLRFLTIVAVFVLVAAACGDSGTTDLADDTTAAATGDTSASGGATAATSGDTAPPATSIGTIPVNIGNIPGLSDDCQALANVFFSFSGVFTGGASPDLSLDAIGELPNDIQDDMAMMLEALQFYSDKIAELGLDFSDPASFAALTEEQQQALAEAGELVDTDEFNDATDRLSAFAETECSEFTG